MNKRSDIAKKIGEGVKETARVVKIVGDAVLTVFKVINEGEKIGGGGSKKKN